MSESLFTCDHFFCAIALQDIPVDDDPHGAKLAAKDPLTEAARVVDVLIKQVRCMYHTHVHKHTHIYTAQQEQMGFLTAAAAAAAAAVAAAAAEYLAPHFCLQAIAAAAAAAAAAMQHSQQGVQLSLHVPMTH